MVFISDLVLSSELWAGSLEHQEVVVTIMPCFLFIPHPWDVAATSGLDFEIERVNVAFKIRSIYRTRFLKPFAGNNNRISRKKESSFP